MTIYRINLPIQFPNKEQTRRNQDNYLADMNILEVTNKKLFVDESMVNNAWHNKRYGFNLAKNEIELFFLHKSAWEKFLKSGEQKCLIIEDSLLLDEFPEFSFLENFEDDTWDVYFPYDRDDVFQTPSILRDLEILNSNIREEDETEPYLTGRKWGSMIYFLSRKGAEILLSIDKLRQNIEDEILFLACNDEANVYTVKLNWFDYQKQPKILNHQREREIRDAIFNSDGWTNQSKTQARELLKIIGQVGKECQANLILQGGSMLGYIRHGGFMPWDDDIDIGIDVKDVDLFFEKLALIPNVKYKKHTEYHTGADYFKVWLIDGVPIKGYSYTFPFVDIWMYQITGDDIAFVNGIICPNSAKKELQEVDYEGARFMIPFNSIECLDTRYKDWRTKIRVYNWRHSKEDFSFHNLSTSIEVDHHGRIILD